METIKYFAQLASRIANNHCELCSYFAPDENGKSLWDSREGKTSSWLGYSSPCICPSCGRGCSRFFIPENSVGLKRVPDSHETKLHAHPGHLLTLPPPINSRGGFDFEAWQTLLKLKASESSTGTEVLSQIRNSNPKIKLSEQPKPDTSQAGTIKSFRLKF